MTYLLRVEGQPRAGVVPGFQCLHLLQLLPQRAHLQAVTRQQCCSSQASCDIQHLWTVRETNLQEQPPSQEGVLGTALCTAG